MKLSKLYIESLNYFTFKKAEQEYDPMKGGMVKKTSLKKEKGEPPKAKVTVKPLPPVNDVPDQPSL